VDLQDKVIIITGASSGFGEAIARRCARQGARLALVARSADRLEQLAAELGGPGRAIAVAADVTRDEAVQAMSAKVLGHYGRADVLVNNAGYGVLDPVESVSVGDLQAMMDVNVYGALRCTQALLPHMRARRSGQIVVMSSIAGLLPFRNMGLYCATKHAMVGLFSTLQVELGGSGVRCAIVCPGPSRTTFMQRAEIAKYPRITYLTPWLTAEQVADAVARVIARGSDGRVIMPWQAVPLVISGQLLPGISRLVMRLVR
jgi:NADP-dependent 3-hydroxy acid dehydrogenase YdfG